MTIWKTVFDPSSLFVILCFSIPLILAVDNAERIRFLTDGTLWACLTILFATVAVTRSQKKEGSPALSKADDRIATWFLLNGAIIHIFMDGLMGVFKLCPPFQRHYAKLDVRYATSDATVDVVSLVELFVMGPLSLLVYYAIHTQKSWRHPLTIFVSAIQLFGGILFVFSEVWWKGIHIPVDFNLEFTFDHVVYFWFGFLLANSIWFTVPTYLICDSSAKISKIIQAAEAGSGSDKSASSPKASKASKSVTKDTQTVSEVIQTISDDAEDESVNLKRPMRRSSSRLRSKGLNA